MPGEQYLAMEIKPLIYEGKAFKYTLLDSNVPKQDPLYLTLHRLVSDIGREVAKSFDNMSIKNAEKMTLELKVIFEE